MQTPQNQNKQHQERKKTLEKIQLDEIKPSNRKYPYVDFKPDREPGKEILQVKKYIKNSRRSKTTKQHIIHSKTRQQNSIFSRQRKRKKQYYSK